MDFINIPTSLLVSWLLVFKLLHNLCRFASVHFIHILQALSCFYAPNIYRCSFSSYLQMSLRIVEKFPHVPPVTGQLVVWAQEGHCHRCLSLRTESCSVLSGMRNRCRLNKVELLWIQMKLVISGNFSISPVVTNASRSADFSGEPVLSSDWSGVTITCGEHKDGAKTGWLAGWLSVILLSYFYRILVPLLVMMNRWRRAALCALRGGLMSTWSSHHTPPLCTDTVCMCIVYTIHIR